MRACQERDRLQERENCGFAKRAVVPFLTFTRFEPKTIPKCKLCLQNVPEPCESRCTLKPALAPPSAVGGQNVFIPSESRSLLFLYSLSVFPIGNTPFMRFTHSSIVRTCGEYAKRTNEMFSIGKHQVKHRLSFSTRYFLRKYFVRSTNSPCLQAEAFPAKGEDIKKARGRKSPAGVYV